METGKQKREKEREQEHETQGTGGLAHIDWPCLASVVVCIGAALVLGWFLMKHALGIALPFAIAWLLSLLIRPLIRRMCAGGRIPRAPVAAVLVLLFTGLAGWLSFLGVRRAVSEVENLIIRLGGTSPGEEGMGAVSGTVGEVMDWITSLSEHLPILRHFEEKPGFATFCAWLDESVRSAASRLVSDLSGWLSSGAVNLVRGLPSMLVFLVVLFLSCYYFSADDGRLWAGCSSLLPARLRQKLPELQTSMSRFCKGYLRAYLILGLITFGEMFLGLWLLGVPYAFLLALVIAVVDFLPVFGTGTVLIPWAVVALIMHDMRRGLGLLILYGISVIVRQIAEPRLIGRSLGLHPMLSLTVMYAGLCLFGLPGMLISPLVAVLIKAAADHAKGESAQK